MRKIIVITLIAFTLSYNLRFLTGETDIEKQTKGLLVKFLGKPYDEFMRMYTERMEAVKHKFIPEFGYSSLEDYLKRNFLWADNNPSGIWPWRRDHLLFEVDENGLIQEHRV